MTAMKVPDPGQLWYEPDHAALCCLECGGDFLKRPLVRTFQVNAATKIGQRGIKISAHIRLPALKKDLILFHRHLECLIDARTPFHAVSHVWDPRISLVQQSGHSNATEASRGPRQLALEHPIRIYEGLARFAREGGPAESMHTESFELWHDYISVPQWTTPLKNNILGVIHDIFNSATTTVIYFDDISPDSVEKLYHGKTSQDIIQGLTDVCRARWFSRVWTAMEFMRSGSIQMMLSDYTLCNEHSGDPLFWKRLHVAWREEAEKLPNKSLARKIHIGHNGNLLPWNLGSLVATRNEAQKRNFGLAFALLSKRGCREERDFLYAMRGLLATGKESSTEPLSDDFEAEYQQIARSCLKAGDYSPLLLTPAVPFVQDPRTRKGDIFQAGYNDVFTWGLGAQISPPYHVRELCVPKDIHSTAVTVKLQSIGIISAVHRLNKCYTNVRLAQNEQFGQCAYVAAQYSGLDVNRFVSALGSRLYSADKADVMLEIGTSDNLGVLQKILHDRFGSPDPRVWQGTGLHGARWLADVMGLTKPRAGQKDALSFCSSHGGTLHGGGTRINCLIGVTCFTCHETDVYRVASFVELSELRHAKAYRIPGLRYQFTHQDGMGLLEKNGRVVGRMIWATPACQCQETLMVKLLMPGLPPRRTSANA